MHHCFLLAAKSLEEHLKEIFLFLEYGKEIREDEKRFGLFSYIASFHCLTLFTLN